MFTVTASRGGVGVTATFYRGSSMWRYAQVLKRQGWFGNIKLYGPHGPITL